MKLTFTATDEHGQSTEQQFSFGHESFGGEDVTPPELSVQLVQDTLPDLSDGITSNITLEGSVSDAGNSNLLLRLFIQATGQFFAEDLTSEVDSLGTFRVDPSLLEAIIGGPLPFGYYDMEFVAEDANSNRTRQQLVVGYEPPDGADVFPPALEARLPHALSQGGLFALTSDPMVVGQSVDANGVTLRAELFVQSLGTSFHDDITSQLDANGAFELDREYFELLLGGPLPLTDYTLTLRSTDDLGNERQLPIQFLLLDSASDVQPPNLAAFLINDDGAHPSDNITTDPSIQGYVEDTSSFQLTFDLFHATSGTTISEDVTGLIESDGTFQIVESFLTERIGSPLPEGSYSITLRADDGANSTSRQINIVIGSIIPTVISAIDADTGRIANDGITLDRSLVFSGFADSRKSVQLFEPTLGFVGSADEDGSGSWVLDLTHKDLAEGTYNFTANATDPDFPGPPLVSEPFLLQIDVTPPTPAAFKPRPDS